MVAAKLWLVVDGHWWWGQNYGWSWVVLGGDGKIMAGLVRSWVVATKLWLLTGGRGWSHDLVMPVCYLSFFFLQKKVVIIL